MPLHKTIKVNPTTEILVWKITESLEWLEKEVLLSEKNQVRFDRLKSRTQQQAFLSVRKLISLKGYSDFDMVYDDLGKPHLTNQKYISVSHSHNFATIIISDRPVGIDIEKRQEKIIAIAPRFMSSEEIDTLADTNSSDYIEKLTVVWGSKEALFKLINKKGISFQNHFKINPFALSDAETTINLYLDDKNTDFRVYFQEIDKLFTLVYTLENELK